jgi:hypothetical protein
VSFSFPDVLTDGIRAEVEKVKASAITAKSSLALEWTTAAEAVRFAVEEFPAVRTLGAWMQVGVATRFAGCMKVLDIRCAERWVKPPFPKQNQR